VRSGEWDATSRTWNKLLATRRRMDGRCAGGPWARWEPSSAGRLRANPSSAPASADQVTFQSGTWLRSSFDPCATCHRPGEAAPFSLLNYSDVKKHARQIVEGDAVACHAPVAAGAAEVEVADELRLGGCGNQSIQRWVEQGEVEGDPADLPPPPKSSKAGGWASLIWFSRRTSRLRCPPQAPTRTGNFYFFWFRFKKRAGSRRFEIRPGDKRYVHHANLLVDREGSSRKREAEPGAGFGGMEIRIESECSIRTVTCSFWKPGTVPYVEPEGMRATPRPRH